MRFPGRRCWAIIAAGALVLALGIVSLAQCYDDVLVSAPGTWWEDLSLPYDSMVEGHPWFRLSAGGIYASVVWHDWVCSGAGGWCLSLYYNHPDGCSAYYTNPSHAIIPPITGWDLWYVTGTQCGAFTGLPVPAVSGGESTDTTPPVLTVPPQTSIECDESLHPDNTGWATATDTCDPNPSVTYTDRYGYFAGPCRGGYFYRDWKATDLAGNESTGTQVVCFACADYTLTDYTSGWVTSLPATVEISFAFEKCATGAEVALRFDTSSTWYFGAPAPIVSNGITENTLTVDLPSGAPEGTYIWWQVTASAPGSPVRDMAFFPEEDYGQVRFEVDVTPPCVTSVTPSDVLITDEDCGPGKTFTLTIEFSEAMDPNVAPAIGLYPDVSSTLALVSGDWTEEDQYVATYEVTDAFVEVEGVDIDVQGAQDLAGHPLVVMIPWTLADAFDIDTANCAISNVQLITGSPVCLCFGQWFEVEFDYATDYPGNVLIFARPFTGGVRTPGYTAHASPWYAPGSGSSSGFFYFEAEGGPTIVDQVRIQMLNESQDTVLVELFVDVDAQWGWQCDTTPPVLTVPPQTSIECDESLHPDNTGWATATDTCDPNPSVTYTDRYGYYGGPCRSGFFYRDWKATDAAGNEATGTQVVCYTCADYSLTDYTSGYVTSLPATVSISFTFDKCATSADVLVHPYPSSTWYWSGQTSIVSDGVTVNTLTVDLPADAPEGTYIWWQGVAFTSGSPVREMLFYPEEDYGSVRFEVDVTPPCVTSVTPSDVLITDEDCGPGKTFTLTIEFSEAMDPNVAPAIGLYPDVSSTLALVSGDWTEEDQYVATYEVTDAFVEVEGVNIDVQGGQDLAGHPLVVMIPWTLADAFDIDTRNVALSSIVISPTSPTCLCYGEHLTVEFDYTTDYPGDVLIFARPFTGGARTPGYYAHPSPHYPAGSGHDDGWFYFTAEDGVTLVDEVRVQMLVADSFELLVEISVPVEAQWGLCPQDATPPVLVMPPDVTIECDESCDPSNTGQATATDNCDPAPAVSYSDDRYAMSGYSYIDRTWVATDAAANSVTAVQEIRIRAPDVTITASAPVWVSALPAGVSVEFVIEKCATSAHLAARCDQDWSVHHYSPDAAVVADGTTVNAQVIDVPAGAPEGTYHLFWTVMAGPSPCWFALLTRGPSFLYGVDLTPPVFAGCPADFSVDAWPGDETAVASWIEPTASDAWSGVASLTRSHAPGDTFPVGTTTVTYAATDLVGHSSTCRFDVTVIATTVVTTPTTGTGILDRSWPEGEEPPAMGELPLAAVYETGEVIAGGFVLTTPWGEPITEPVIVTVYRVVEFGEEFDVREPLDAFYIYSDDGTYTFGIETEGLESGTYDIRLGLPDGGVQWLRVEVVPPAEE